jgi:hypothetical protein
VLATRPHRDDVAAALLEKTTSRDTSWTAVREARSNVTVLDDTTAVRSEATVDQRCSGSYFPELVRAVKILREAASPASQLLRTPMDGSQEPQTVDSRTTSPRAVSPRRMANPDDNRRAAAFTGHWPGPRPTREAPSRYLAQELRLRTARKCIRDETGCAPIRASVCLLP